jgi:hypothetical protein
MVWIIYKFCSRIEQYCGRKGGLFKPRQRKLQRSPKTSESKACNEYLSGFPKNHEDFFAAHARVA